MAGSTLSAALGGTIYPGLRCGGAAGDPHGFPASPRLAALPGGSSDDPGGTGPSELGRCEPEPLGHKRGYRFCKADSGADAESGGYSGQPAKPDTDLHPRRPGGGERIFGDRHGRPVGGPLRPAGAPVPVGSGCPGHHGPGKPGHIAVYRDRRHRHLFHLRYLPKNNGLHPGPAAGKLQKPA